MDKDRLFYYDEDIKEASNWGYWTGFIVGVITVSIPVGFALLFVKVF